MVKYPFNYRFSINLNGKQNTLNVLGCKSEQSKSWVSKSRRSRKDRDNDKSIGRINIRSSSRTSSNFTLNNTSNQKITTAKFSKKSNIKVKSKHQSPFWTKNNQQKTTEEIGNPQWMYVKKASNLITRKTFDALKRIRPIQSSIKVIRGFITILKFYNPTLKYLNENDNLMNLFQSIKTHSSVLLREIKLLCFKCTKYDVIPDVLEEIRKKVLSRKEKNVPSCSSSFQRELKPFASLLLSLVQYYNSKGRVQVEKATVRSKSALRSLSKTNSASYFKKYQISKPQNITLNSELKQQ